MTCPGLAGLSCLSSLAVVKKLTFGGRQELDVRRMKDVDPREAASRRNHPERDADPSYDVIVRTATVLFDADCGFCRWSATKIRAWDGHDNLGFVALQSAEAAELLRALDPSRRFASWHVVDGLGRVWSGGAALSPLLRLLPFGRPFAWFAELAPGLTERGYSIVADHRDRLGRIVGERACGVDPSSTKT
jgi:predicted DCC family thiol-disulfide oxidoreductase YuxK